MQNADTPTFFPLSFSSTLPTPPSGQSQLEASWQGTLKIYLAEIRLCHSRVAEIKGYEAKQAKNRYQESTNFIQKKKMLYRYGACLLPQVCRGVYLGLLTYDCLKQGRRGAVEEYVLISVRINLRKIPKESSAIAPVHTQILAGGGGGGGSESMHAHWFLSILSNSSIPLFTIAFFPWDYVM